MCNPNAGGTICNNRGNITLNNCTDCICKPCSNGGVNDRYCNCNCPSPWARNPNTLDCTVCSVSSQTLCNGFGTVNSTCNGCICQARYAGPYCNTCSNTSTCGQGYLTFSSECSECQCPRGSGWSGSRCQTCKYVILLI